MTFSLRLTADLTLALAARRISNGPGHPPILQLSSDNDFQLASDLVSYGDHQAESLVLPTVSQVQRYRYPIVWMGGSEPLDHPEVARLTNALAASGRHVFLLTSGAALKPRLHEFQPSSRFYFTVRFDCCEALNDRRNANECAFRIGLEAIRMARLAGFYTCAQLVLHSNTGGSELEKLHAEIRELDVDGFLITLAEVTPELKKTASHLRGRLLNRRWALLSNLVDSITLPSMPRNSREIERRPIPESQPGNFGEGAEAG
jgi:hypothetical protein